MNLRVLRALHAIMETEIPSPFLLQFARLHHICYFMDAKMILPLTCMDDEGWVCLYDTYLHSDAE